MTFTVQINEDEIKDCAALYVEEHPEYKGVTPEKVHRIICDVLADAIRSEVAAKWFDIACEMVTDCIESEVTQCKE